MPKADMYRDRARRLRVMAHETSAQIHRELLDISEQYERLADQAEMMSRTPVWAPGSTPNAAPSAPSRADDTDKTAMSRPIERATRR